MAKNRQLELDVKAHELAKEIEKFTNSYDEAMSMINRIKDNFTWARSRTKVSLPAYPVDRWGQKVIMPKTDALGIEEEN